MLQLSEESTSVFWKKSHLYRPNVGEDLDVVKQDHCVITNPATNRNRRTLVISKERASWGFTLQSYGIHHQTEDAIEYLTYVEYVEIGGPADLAGMRKGDIILSVNGRSMENKDHHQMVEFLRLCGNTIRMVVLFEDCNKKVELHLRYMKLKSLLAAKEKELRSIDNKLNHLQHTANHSAETLWCHKQGSTHFDPCTIPSSVNALATLPRKPNRHRKKEIHLSRLVNSSTGLQSIHSIPELHAECAQEHSSNISAKCDMLDHQPEGKGCLLSSSALSASLQSMSSNSSSSGHSQPIDSPRDQVFSGPLPNQYNSLPIRGVNKHQRSQKIPEIVKSVPVQGTDCLDQHISPTTVVAKSPGSECFVPSASLVVANTITPDMADSDVVPSFYIPGPQIRSQVPDHPGYVKSGLLKRSMSFRASFRNSMSPVLGQSYTDSSNHVLTEHNTRIHSDPELIRIRHGHLDLHSPDYVEKTRQPALVRSISSPAFKTASSSNEKMKMRMSPTEKMLQGMKDGFQLKCPTDIGRLMMNKLAPCGHQAQSLKPSEATRPPNSSTGKKSNVNLMKYSYNCSIASGGCTGSCPALNNCTSDCQTSTEMSSLLQTEHYTQAGHKRSEGTLDRNANITNATPLLDHTSHTSLNHTRKLQRCKWNTSTDIMKSKPNPMSQSLSVGGQLDAKNSTSFNTEPLTVSTLPSCPKMRNTAKHIINYIRHKDILQQDKHLKYINEEDQCTKL